MNVQEAAAKYATLGWYSVRLRPHSKACVDDDWRTHIYKPTDFKEGDNLGLRLINQADPRQVKLVAVDLDCREATALAWEFLPRGPAWGRASKTISQILYDAPFDKTLVWKDVGQQASTLLELRVDHQSMAPPSIWASKDNPADREQLEWLDEPVVAPRLKAEELLRSVRLLATAILIKRHYAPPGARHDWCLALTGSLRQLALTEQEAVKVLEAAGKLEGDLKLPDRLVELRGTYAKPADGKIAGFGRLVELTSEDFAQALKRTWGWTDRKRAKEGESEPEVVLNALGQVPVTFTKDIFANRMYAVNGTGKARILSDEVVDQLWLDLQTTFQLKVNRASLDIIVKSAARKASFHPVQQWLEGLKWDGQPRLNTWLRDYGGAADGPYFEAVGAIPLIAAVRRVRVPGCKFDELLVLEGEQGKNKSSALRALCPHEEWFSDDLPLNVTSKEVIERTTGKWLVEAAELVSMRGAQVEGLKAMLSRQVDGPVRLAYERFAVEIPRQFVVIGTTNSFQYLQDATGNRRFWPVRIVEFDVKRLMADRDQLWAEAASREAVGESVRLNPDLYDAATKQQDRRRVADPWEEAIKARWPRSGDPAKDYARVSDEEIFGVIRLSIDKRTRSDSFRIGAIMQGLGFSRTTVKKEKKFLSGWRREDKRSVLDSFGADQEKPSNVT